MDEKELKRINDALTAAATRGMVGGLLGLPVDVGAQAMGLLGYQHPRPVMGSEWINDRLQQYGLLGQSRAPIIENLLAGAVTAPIGVGKAVQTLYR